MDTSLKLYESGHELGCTLRPTTPAQSGRYFGTGKNQLSHKLISPGSYSYARALEPPYLAADWSVCTQPEGQRYFFNCKSRVVTETNIYIEKANKRVSYWIKTLEDLVQSRGIELLVSVEVFLHVEANADEFDGDCWYYLVDHASRSVFWLEELSTEDLGIPETASSSQLRWALEEQYWNHVEYFPMHLSGIPISVARELVSVFVHARADHLTSSVGTFPYSATQCKDFSELVQGHLSNQSSQTIIDGSFICVVARFWSQVARHRFLNFYGEEFARLSRDQSMLDAASSSNPFYIRLLSRLLFNEPASFLKELEKLWVDNLVYAEPWKQFMIASLNEWKEALQWTAALIIVHSLFFSFEIGSQPVALASLALSVTGFISGLMLTHYHRMPLYLDTSDAANFLSQAYHSSLGLRPLAIVYALPRALLFWSTGLMALQAGSAVFRTTDIYIGSGLLFLAVITVCLMSCVLRRGFASDPDVTPYASWWRRLFCPPRKANGDLEYNGETLP